MTIKMVKTCAGDIGTYAAGSIVESMTAATQAHLVDIGAAIWVGDPLRVEQPEQYAVKSIPERAIKRRGRPRKGGV